MHQRIVNETSNLARFSSFRSGHLDFCPRMIEHSTMTLAAIAVNQVSKSADETKELGYEHYRHHEYDGFRHLGL